VREWWRRAAVDEARGARKYGVPYLLHDAVESDTILIVEVHHAKRRATSWRDRLT
jgi:hypothetical protein